jgi:hypothetical protein
MKSLFQPLETSTAACCVQCSAIDDQGRAIAIVLDLDDVGLTSATFDIPDRISS